MTITNTFEVLKTYFIVKERENFSIVKVIVAEYRTKDCIKRGKETFATVNILRQEYPDDKFIINTITAPTFDLPLTLDKSLIEYRVIA